MTLKQALEERHLGRSRSTEQDELSLPSTSSSSGGGASCASDSVGGVDAEVTPWGCEVGLACTPTSGLARLARNSPPCLLQGLISCTASRWPPSIL